MYSLCTTFFDMCESSCGLSTERNFNKTNTLSGGLRSCSCSGVWMESLVVAFIAMWNTELWSDVSGTLRGRPRTTSSRTGRRRSATLRLASRSSRSQVELRCASRTSSLWPTAKCTGRSRDSTSALRSTGTKARRTTSMGYVC